MIERKEQLAEGKSYDVVVIGGGLAGVAAAYSAARCGAKAVIIEKSVMLGGLATLGQVNWFVSMCNGRGKLICRGLAEEFVLLATKYGFGGVPKDFVDGVIPQEKLDEYKAKGVLPPRYKSGFSIGIFTLQLAELLVNAGVEIYYDTIFSDVVKCDDDPNKIKGIIIENKSGRSVIFGKQFVDASGDCDVFARLGAPTVKRGGYHFLAAIATDLEHMQNAIDKKNVKLAFFDTNGGKVNLYGRGPEEDVAKGTYDGTDGEDVNRYLIANQLQMLEKWKDEEHRMERDIVFPSGMVQVRTSRRIDGMYTMTTDDAYRHFYDSVCAICDFDRRDYLYEIPLRALTVEGYSNVSAAGRIISADGYAWDFTRVIPPAILTGQAAGVAAAHAVSEGKAVYGVDIAALQKELAKQKVMIHFDDADVPAESSDTIEYNDK